MDGPYHYTFFHEGEKNNNQFNQVIFFKQVQIGALVSSDHDINYFFSGSDQIHYNQELLLCARAYFRTTVCQTVSAITISTFYLLLVTVQGWLCIQHNQIWTFWQSRNCKQILLQKSQKETFHLCTYKESRMKMWMLLNILA